MLTRLTTPSSTACNVRLGGYPKTATSAQFFPPITKGMFRANFENLSFSIFENRSGISFSSLGYEKFSFFFAQDIIN